MRAAPNARTSSAHATTAHAGLGQGFSPDTRTDVTRSTFAQVQPQQVFASDQSAARTNRCSQHARNSHQRKYFHGSAKLLDNEKRVEFHATH